MVDFKAETKKRVRRKAVTEASVGNKDEARDGKPGSESHPVVDVEHGPDREVDLRDHCLVGVSFGLTRSMGNYEFARIDVRVEDWCPRSEKDAKYEELRSFCSTKVNMVSAQITGYVNAKLKASGVESPHG